MGFIAARASQRTPADNLIRRFMDVCWVKIEEEEVRLLDASPYCTSSIRIVFTGRRWPNSFELSPNLKQKTRIRDDKNFRCTWNLTECVPRQSSESKSSRECRHRRCTVAFHRTAVSSIPSTTSFRMSGPISGTLKRSFLQAGMILTSHRNPGLPWGW